MRMFWGCGIQFCQLPNTQAHKLFWCLNKLPKWANLVHLSRKQTLRVSHLFYFTYNIYPQCKSQNEVHWSISVHIGGEWKPFRTEITAKVDYPFRDQNTNHFHIRYWTLDVSSKIFRKRHWKWRNYPFISCWTVQEDCNIPSVLHLAIWIKEEIFFRMSGKNISGSTKLTLNHSIGAWGCYRGNSSRTQEFKEWIWRFYKTEAKKKFWKKYAWCCKASEIQVGE